MKRFFFRKSQKKVDDVRISEIKALASPIQIIKKTQTKDEIFENVYSHRQDVKKILNFADDRLIVVIGPCSIHDPIAAKEYAAKLYQQSQIHERNLKIVMRVYFEKPRTNIGWKGLINDPNLDGSNDINKGLIIARKLITEINKIGLPVGCEFLDMITPQYIADLVTWGAIGARTTESQVHRELASGLSCSIGFKNGTDGNLAIAVDAILTAMHPHCFLSVTKKGQSAIVRTSGNEATHIILRGSKKDVNYQKENVNSACQELAKAGIMQRLMIDFSHANSQKKYKKQLEVCSNVSEQIAIGEKRIIGVMIESNLEEDRQDLQFGKKLKYGQSITDACIGWEDTLKVLNKLAKAVEKRRVICSRN